MIRDETSHALFHGATRSRLRWYPLLPSKAAPSIVCGLDFSAFEVELVLNKENPTGFSAPVRFSIEIIKSGNLGFGFRCCPYKTLAADGLGLSRTVKLASRGAEFQSK